MSKTPSASILKGAHLVIGFAVLAVFSASGLYLRYKAPYIYLGDEVSHMMFRANHIYILMAGFVHVWVGRYVASVESKNGRFMESAGLGFAMAGSVVLIYAFLLEPALGSFERTRTVLGVALLFAGTVLHVLSGL